MSWSQNHQRLTFVQVMSGKAPYEGVAPGMILLRVMMGTQPDPKAHPELPVSDPLWDLMRKCWSSDPRSRPSMKEVVDVVRNCSRLGLREPSTDSPILDI